MGHVCDYHVKCGGDRLKERGTGRRMAWAVANVLMENKSIRIISWMEGEEGRQTTYQRHGLLAGEFGDKSRVVPDGDEETYLGAGSAAWNLQARAQVGLGTQVSDSSVRVAKSQLKMS